MSSVIHTSNSKSQASNEHLFFFSFVGSKVVTKTVSWNHVQANGLWCFYSLYLFEKMGKKKQRIK